MGVRVKVCRRHMLRHPLDEPCPLCPPKRGRDSAARAAQRRFRGQLLAASDGQCAYTDADGNRCSITEGLEAAHIGEAYADGAGFASGALLCPTHHRYLDRRTHGHPDR